MCVCVCNTYEESQEQTYIDTTGLERAINNDIEQDMVKFSAEDALDTQIASYADELKYFFNCVCKKVIERHLVHPLTENILSPITIAGLTDAQIAALAVEAPEVPHNRNRLEDRKKVLESRLKVFKEALGVFA